jgi:hypothetical protein
LGLFFIYKVFINLLALRAVGFIKLHVYRDLNTTGGFVENTVANMASYAICSEFDFGDS